MHDAMAGASSGRRTEPEMLRSYHQHARCAVACNEMSVQRYSSFITVTRLRIDASSHGETAYGAAASAKSELLTYAYYVRTLKYYAPAIYHGQGLARYGRMGSD